MLKKQRITVTTMAELIHCYNQPKHQIHQTNGNGGITYNRKKKVYSFHRTNKPTTDLIQLRCIGETRPREGRDAHADNREGDVPWVEHSRLTVRRRRERRIPRELLLGQRRRRGGGAILKVSRGRSRAHLDGSASSSLEPAPAPPDPLPPRQDPRPPPWRAWMKCPYLVLIIE